mmetsp:Transcript_11335/g.47326  ORF Transcript_11335/g.47326 Transcript_11335/m.47326 type:complete len:261 (-) Transcript_11335:2721-3503(-)
MAPLPTTAGRWRAPRTASPAPPRRRKQRARVRRCSSSGRRCQRPSQTSQRPRQKRPPRRRQTLMLLCRRRSRASSRLPPWHPPMRPQPRLPWRPATRPVPRPPPPPRRCSRRCCRRRRARCCAPSVRWRSACSRALRLLTTAHKRCRRPCSAAASTSSPRPSAPTAAGRRPARRSARCCDAAWTRGPRCARGRWWLCREGCARRRARPRTSTPLRPSRASSARFFPGRRAPTMPRRRWPRPRPTAASARRSAARARRCSS